MVSYFQTWLKFVSCDKSEFTKNKTAKTVLNSIGLSKTCLEHFLVVVLVCLTSTV